MEPKDLLKDFYLGGYFIISPLPRAEWMNSSVVHENVLSASRCFCNRYPDIDVIWSQSKKKKDENRDSLNLSNSTYNEMEDLINKWYANESFYYPDVFKSVNFADEFYNKFLNNIPGLKIIGIALPKTLKESFLEDDNDFRYGICSNINKSLPMDENGIILGYEILGYDYGTFHSYLCNGLEDDYSQKFQFKLNENGFIKTLEEAEMLSNYTNEEIEGTEPVLWLPWIIVDYTRV